MRVLRNHPLPTQMPAHGLVKILGPLAETSNSSTPRQEASALQRNPCKMRQTKTFHLIKTFCCSQSLLLPSFKIWTSVKVKDSEEKQLQWRICARGTLPSQILECIPLETEKKPQIPYLFHWFTPTVKAEGKAAGAGCSLITDLESYSSLIWASA